MKKSCSGRKFPPPPFQGSFRSIPCPQGSRPISVNLSSIHNLYLDLDVDLDVITPHTFLRASGQSKGELGRPPQLWISRSAPTRCKHPGLPRTPSHCRVLWHRSVAGLDPCSFLSLRRCSTEWKWMLGEVARPTLHIAVVDYRQFPLQVAGNGRQLGKRLACGSSCRAG
jgi:hypothetical protein